MAAALKCKLVLVGDPGVGKASIVTRFVDDTFDREHQGRHHGGILFRQRTISFTRDEEPRDCVVTLCHASGSRDQARTMSGHRYRQVDAYVIVYSAYRRAESSLHNCHHWLPEIERFGGNAKNIFVVASHADVANSDMIEMGKQFVETNRLAKFFLVSSKDGDCSVSNALHEIVSMTATKAVRRGTRAHKLVENRDELAREANERQDFKLTWYEKISRKLFHRCKINFDESAISRSKDLVESKQAIYCGWLTKQGSKFHTWRRRFFVLNPDSLEYFEEPSGRSKGVISVRLIRCVIEDQEDELKLRVIANDRVLLCKCDSVEQRDEWIEAIQSTITFIPASIVTIQQSIADPPGAMCEVCQAQITPQSVPRYSSSVQMLLQHPLAIKFPRPASLYNGDPHDIKRVIQREIEILQEMTRSPFIIQFIGHGIIDIDQVPNEASDKLVTDALQAISPQIPFLMTEKAAGSLSSIIFDQHYVLTAREQWQALYDLASAVSFLHGHVPMIMHGDLSMSNILYTSDWTIKISDFGSACWCHSIIQPIRAAGYVCKTPGYEAPEFFDTNALDKPRLTIKSDIWSYGVLLYEILHRQRAWVFDGQLAGHMTIRSKVLAQEVIPLPATTSALWAVLKSADTDEIVRHIEACMSWLPEDRDSAEATKAILLRAARKINNETSQQTPAWSRTRTGTIDFASRLAVEIEAESAVAQIEKDTTETETSSISQKKDVKIGFVDDK